MAHYTTLTLLQDSGRGRICYSSGGLPPAFPAVSTRIGNINQKHSAPVPFLTMWVRRSDPSRVWPHLCLSGLQQGPVACKSTKQKAYQRSPAKFAWAILFYSILGCVFPLQEVTLHQSLPSSSDLCYPRPYRSLLPHNVISPTTFWSSDLSYTLCLSLCACISPSIIFHSGDVSSPFPFRIGHVLDYACHSGSLPNGGVTNSVI